MKQVKMFEVFSKLSEPQNLKNTEGIQGMKKNFKICGPNLSIYLCFDYVKVLSVHCKNNVSILQNPIFCKEVPVVEGLA